MLCFCSENDDFQCYVSVQKMTEEMNLQKDSLQQKLESRRLMKETQDYEDLAAKTILKLAKEQHSRAMDSVKREKGKQSSLVGCKLMCERITAL